MTTHPIPGVNITGNLRSEKGVGEASRCLVRAVRAAGIPHTLNDFVDTEAANAGGDPPPAPGGYPHSITLLSVNPDTIPLFGLNVDLPSLRAGRYTVGYWFWELPEFPPEWLGHFDAVDEVWVGSSFAQDAVGRAAPVPVVCVPPALDPDPVLVPLSRTALGLPPDAYVILFAFDASSQLRRKNPVGLIAAFRAAFPTQRDVRLVLKSSRLNLAPDRDELLRAVAADDRVVLLGGTLTRPQMTGLLALADCYASLHRAEGFGLTPAEAMLLGKPVVATAYSGVTDFLTPFNGLPVDFSPVTLDRDHGPYRAGQTWAEPDLDHAASQLRWAYENRDAAARMGQRARTEVLAKFHPAVVGERIARRLAVIQAAYGPPAGA